MTLEELDAIEARAKAATEGPWEQDGRTVYVLEAVPGRYIKGKPLMQNRICIGVSGVAPAEEMEATAAFLRSARSDVPALVAEVRRLREALENIANRRLGSSPVTMREFAARTLNPMLPEEWRPES